MFPFNASPDCMFRSSRGLRVKVRWKGQKPHKLSVQAINMCVWLAWLDKYCCVMQENSLSTALNLLIILLVYQFMMFSCSVVTVWHNKNAACGSVPPAAAWGTWRQGWYAGGNSPGPILCPREDWGIHWWSAGDGGARNHSAAGGWMPCTCLFYFRLICSYVPFQMSWIQ